MRSDRARLGLLRSVFGMFGIEKLSYLDSDHMCPGSKDSGQMLETKLINKTKTKPWLKVGK